MQPTSLKMSTTIVVGVVAFGFGYLLSSMMQLQSRDLIFPHLKAINDGMTTNGQMTTTPSPMGMEGRNWITIDQMTSEFGNHPPADHRMTSQFGSHPRAVHRMLKDLSCSSANLELFESLDMVK